MNAIALPGDKVERLRDEGWRIANNHAGQIDPVSAEDRGPRLSAQGTKRNVQASRTSQRHTDSSGGIAKAMHMSAKKVLDI